MGATAVVGGGLRCLFVSLLVAHPGRLSELGDGPSVLVTKAHRVLQSATDVNFTHKSINRMCKRNEGGQEHTQLGSPSVPPFPLPPRSDDGSRLLSQAPVLRAVLARAGATPAGSGV